MQGSAVAETALAAQRQVQAHGEGNRALAAPSPEPAALSEESVDYQASEL